MILTVSGWRGWTDEEFVIDRLRPYIYNYGDDLFIRVGCAAGVDEIVRRYLLHRGPAYQIRAQVYRADWASLGQAAGPIRNGQMLRGENPDDPTYGHVTDRLLAFPQPGVKMRSPGSGTVGCILDAHLLGVDVEIPGYKGGQ